MSAYPRWVEYADVRSRSAAISQVKQRFKGTKLNVKVDYAKKIPPKSRLNELGWSAYKKYPFLSPVDFDRGGQYKVSLKVTKKR
jgi:hypothetical protein